MGKAELKRCIEFCERKVAECDLRLASVKVSGESVAFLKKRKGEYVARIKEYREKGE